MSKLSKLETQIETNIKKAWYENGLCLREIRDNNLYKKKHSSFKSYLGARWGYETSYGYRLIDSAELFQVLEHQSVAKNGEFGDTLPTSEGQIRPLLSLDNISQQVHVWNTIKHLDEKVTAVVVKREVDAFKESPVEVDLVEVEAKNTNITSSKKDVLYSAGVNDECYTPDYGVRAIIPHLAKFKDKVIWCPFDTDDSLFVSILTEEGFTVVNSHISTGGDFYQYEPDHWDLIVSNPPFTNKKEIFERALSFGKPFALVMSNTWLNDAAPKRIFKERGLQLLMFEERMKFTNQDNKITFSSSYFCCDVLEHTISFDSLKNYGY